MAMHFSEHTENPQEQCHTAIFHPKLAGMTICLNRREKCYYALCMETAILCVHPNRLNFQGGIGEVSDNHPAGV